MTRAVGYAGFNMFQSNDKKTWEAFVSLIKKP